MNKLFVYLLFIGNLFCHINLIENKYVNVKLFMFNKSE